MTKQFTIHNLEKLAGIKAHTIRIWERRYKVFEPPRDQTNKRIYDLGHLQKLLHLALLTRNGNRISRIAVLDPEALAFRVRSVADPAACREAGVNDLILAGCVADTEAFESILTTCVAAWGINSTIRDVIVPYMDRTGLLFYTGTGGAIHFAVTALRKKLIGGIETVSPAGGMRKTALLFLPKGEHFDLILLYTAFKLQTDGLRVLYLGTNVPEESLHEVILQKKPDYLYTYRHPRQKAARPYVLPLVGKGDTIPDYVVVHAHEKMIPETDGRRMVHYRDI
ncbi:MAG: MerR family transcriptional regulator [Flaviaesturariibacter sp.]|nr:MerR family transcriptional regulator [Flaviaesturariibacter sp.]